MISSLRPAPALRSFVKFYYQVETTLEATVLLQPVPARSPEILEFMFATPYLVERLDAGTKSVAAPVALVGVKTSHHVNLFMRERVDAFTIAFQPGGFTALFGIPSGELANLDFDGRNALGPEIATLRDQLGTASAIAERAQIADKFFFRRLADFSHPSPLIRSARLIHRCNGSAQIAVLAERADLGVRHFERRFQREIGIAPKLYCRIVRFEAALRCKAARPERLWTEIACALGYFDQMHMIHDFKRLANDTPGGIGNGLDMFVKPEVELRA